MIAQVAEYFSKLAEQLTTAACCFKCECIVFVRRFFATEIVLNVAVCKRQQMIVASRSIDLVFVLNLSWFMSEVAGSNRNIFLVIIGLIAQRLLDNRHW